jgi:DNA excision repair protein ERCC-4
MSRRPALVIVKDTREQNGYDFASLKPPPRLEVATLPTGDYSVKGLEGLVTVERKSLADAFGSFGRGRPRFERELARLADFAYAAVVIEADWHTILRNPPAFSRLNPKTVLASVVAWTQRFRVHFWACPNRAFAERLTFRLLERFWKDHGTAAQ